MALSESDEAKVNGQDRGLVRSPGGRTAPRSRCPGPAGLQSGKLRLTRLRVASRLLSREAVALGRGRRTAFAVAPGRARRRPAGDRRRKHVWRTEHDGFEDAGGFESRLHRFPAVSPGQGLWPLSFGGLRGRVGRHEVVQKRTAGP